MRITFLGTGTSQGVPIIACNCEVCTSFDQRDRRLRSAVYIEADHTRIVIDTGPDFRQQILTTGIQHLDAVLFTHQHKDHTAGLDDIRRFNYKYQMVMPLYARKQVLTQLQREFAYMFDENLKYPGVPKVSLHEISADQAFTVKSLRVQAIELLHHKLPVFGFRIHDFVYITDANYISPQEFEKIKDCKVLVVNALREEPHLSHFTRKEAIQLSQKTQAQRTYFTHISHLLGKHEDVSKTLPSNIFLAYDGLTIHM